MIKYIGSKRRLIPYIMNIVGSIEPVRAVCDLFTGTTRVAQAFKGAGLTVHANDTATYSELLAECYIATDAADIDRGELLALVEHLQAVPDVDGYATEMFCRQARYFQVHNGMRIDAIRGEIDALRLSKSLRAIALTSLLEAADRVDSTTGLQMAYLKKWAPRSYNDLELRVPELIAGAGVATRADALALASELASYDLTYVDPPYNQHSYYGNYHVWETIARGDDPEAYGIARKRIDCQDGANKSVFNSKRTARSAFEQLVASVASPYLLISFSNEGFLTHDDVLSALRSRGDEVGVMSIDVRRYVGAQIGVHNLKGQRVGRVSHLRNTEYLFLAGRDANKHLELASMRTATRTG